MAKDLRLRFNSHRWHTIGACARAAIARTSWPVAATHSYRRLGVTGDLLRRVFEHKWSPRYGFTRRYNCDRLVWFERHEDVHLAIAREKELKGWRREKKIALIAAVNPTWEDLSRDWYDVEPADYRRALDRVDS